MELGRLSNTLESRFDPLLHKSVELQMQIDDKMF